MGIAVVVAVRFRGKWDAYAALHRWCATKGVPDVVRNLDSLILFVVTAFLGALVAALLYGGGATGWLGLRRGRVGWTAMVLIALLPMVVGGLVLGWMRWTPDTTLAGLMPMFIGGVVRAPIAEEMLFRGLLVGVCAASVGWHGTRFWINAAAASLLFAATHVTWNAQAFVDGWPTLLVTAAGGLWYAWLLARWRSLWVPMTLHAGMNLGWMLAMANGGAGGGGWIENALRVGTIVIATWWSVRSTRGIREPR